MMKLNFPHFVFFEVVFLVALFSVISQAAVDPVISVLDAYNKAVEDFRKQEAPSSETKINWMREWKKRFQEIITENPQNDHIETVKLELLGLNNSLGEFNESQVLLQEMIVGANGPLEKIRWLNELGETFRENYYSSKTQDDAKKSLDAFEQSYALYLSLSPKVQDNEEVGGRQIASLYMAAGMAKILNDHAKSATLFQFARQIFQQSTKSKMFAALVGCDLELIAENEMMEWIQCKNVPNALTALTLFSKLQPYRWPPSYYALKYAMLLYEDDSKNFQVFVAKWLHDNHSDERTPILMAYLAFSYFDDGLFKQSFPIYKILRNKQESFQKLEPDAFRDGRGGCYDKVLSDLAVIYLRSGKFDEAEKVKEELKKLLPQSRNIDLLTSENFTIDLYDLYEIKQQWNVRHLLFRGVLLVIGFLLIVLGLYFHWSNNHSKKTK
jgi:tetratricopeptide (TPR) repeat protein